MRRLAADNDISCEGAQCFVEAMQFQNTVLKVLDLAGGCRGRAAALPSVPGALPTDPGAAMLAGACKTAAAAPAAAQATRAPAARPA
jgi:hypothetical protein